MWKRIAWIAVLLLAVAGGTTLTLMHRKSNTTSSTYLSTMSSGNTNSNTPPVNDSVLSTKTTTNIGQYLTDPSGRTLYTYSNDLVDASKCVGSCLANWPAYIDGGATTGLPASVGVISRSDNGKKQFAYKHKPLYYFAGDTAAGQVTGDGVGGFSVARP